MKSFLGAYIMLTRRQLLGGLGVAAATAAISIFKANSSTPQNTNLAASNHGVATHGSLTHGSTYFPNVELTNHLGQQVKFYDDLIKDKFVVINMMYAQCSEGVCPITTANMRQVQMALGDRVGRDIHMYSITLLPDFDTPNVLKQYAKDHKVGAGWQFLTGRSADIELIRRKLGFYDLDPVVDADKTQHAGVVRIGNDAYNNWMMAPALGSHESILQVIRHADKSLVKA
jgi:protein SCO1